MADYNGSSVNRDTTADKNGPSIDRDAIALHYADLNRNQEKRMESAISQLRVMNNWVKAVLIGLFARQDDDCMDYCSGKGGDMMKWAKAKPRFVSFVDLTYWSVVESVVRYNKYLDQQYQSLMPGETPAVFHANFVWADVCNDFLMHWFNPSHTDLNFSLQSVVRGDYVIEDNDLLKLNVADIKKTAPGSEERRKLERAVNASMNKLIADPMIFRGWFDFISCQFAMHYSFESEFRATRFMQNVASSLKPGAFFVATVPNRAEIIKRVKAQYDSDLEQYRLDKAAGNGPEQPVLHCGSNQLLDGYTDPESVYGLRFEPHETQPESERVTVDARGELHVPTFGARYIFRLVDAIHAIPEYLLPDDDTIDHVIANSCGMELVDSIPFAELFQMFRTAEKVDIHDPNARRRCPRTETVANKPLVELLKLVQSQFSQFESLATNQFRLPHSIEEFDQAQWEAITIYKALVFRRKPVGPDQKKRQPILLNISGSAAFRRAEDIAMVMGEIPPEKPKKEEQEDGGDDEYGDVDLGGII
ncbi:mRNA capping enzyme [Carpediemonas membranifera]|uniref:mRNA cap guanine-N(7) methyltransferase n=1 Tax=Carpediemonas membranifera TaxID=201153 RepID=A0A8J6B4B5_9EUKA|nr:mRNA capping enzyme [Carpediemonas membranifera]|eukprot:KAG9392627.1 mRNA capping enzyme [Carpediemonas membranifera]